MALISDKDARAIASRLYYNARKEEMGGYLYTAHKSFTLAARLWDAVDEYTMADSSRMQMARIDATLANKKA